MHEGAAGRRHGSSGLSGTECVNWLLREAKAASRDEAARLCELLVASNLLYHEAHTHSFQDEPHLIYLVTPADIAQQLRQEQRSPPRSSGGASISS